MTEHYLAQDPWAVADRPEFGWMPLTPLQHTERAADAIHAIARLIGNSVRDTNTPHRQALDAWTVAALMGGVESPCDHLNSLADQMMASVESHARETGDRAGADGMSSPLQ